MESSNCSMPSCFIPVKSLCETHNLSLCDVHIRAHLQEPGEHKEIDISNTSINLEIRESYHFNPPSEGSLLSEFAEEGYFFKLSVVDIPLTEDYESAILSLCKIAARKMAKKSGDDQLLKKKFHSFLQSVKQIIYNAHVNSDKLTLLINSIFNKFNYQIIEANLSKLNDLIDKAKNIFNMKEEAKKALFFKINLADERQKFLGKYLSAEEIDLKVLKERFFDSFSHFFQEKNKDFSGAFDEFESSLSAENKILRGQCEEELSSCLFDYFLREVCYCRVAVFAGRITDGFSVVKHEVSWTMVCCLLLQQGEFLLSKPVAISPSEMLIPLHMKNSSFVIYYSGNNSPSLAQVYNFQDFIIVPGSMTGRIFIIKNKDLVATEYKIFNSKLVKNSEGPLNLKINEEITCILYITDQERFVYIVNCSEIYSMNIGSTVRNRVRTVNETGKILSCAYYKEKKIICILSENALTLYNTKMQFLNTLNVAGLQIATISTFKETGYIILVKDKVLTEVMLTFRYDSNPRSSSSLKNCEVFKKCLHPMSRDHLNEMKKSSKYVEIINKTFKIPDEHINISQLIFDIGETIVPLSINFYKIDINSFENNKDKDCVLVNEQLDRMTDVIEDTNPSLEAPNDCQLSQPNSFLPNHSEIDFHPIPPNIADASSCELIEPQVEFKPEDLNQLPSSSLVHLSQLASTENENEEKLEISEKMMCSELVVSNDLNPPIISVPQDLPEKLDGPSDPPYTLLELPESTENLLCVSLLQLTEHKPSIEPEELKISVIEPDKEKTDFSPIKPCLESIPGSEFSSQIVSFSQDFSEKKEPECSSIDRPMVDDSVQSLVDFEVISETSKESESVKEKHDSRNNTENQESEFLNENNEKSENEDQESSKNDS